MNKSRIVFFKLSPNVNKGNKSMKKTDWKSLKIPISIYTIGFYRYWLLLLSLLAIITRTSYIHNTYSLAKMVL